MNKKNMTPADAHLYDIWTGNEINKMTSSGYTFAYFKKFYKKWNKVTSELLILLDNPVKKKEVLDIFHIG